MMILTEKQQDALDIIQPIGKLALSGLNEKLPLKAKTHILICAPSGTGKTHLMKQLGEILEVRILFLNVSTWQPVGSRSNIYTWNVIVDFLEKNPRGLILLDEIDKLDGNNPWNQYIRLEIYDLLDGRIPQSVNVKEEEEVEVDVDVDEMTLSITSIKEEVEIGTCKRDLLEKRLQNSMFIVAAGAWQHHWEAKKRPNAGFSMKELYEYEEEISQPRKPTLDRLKSSIRPELLKRFSSQIIVMEPMTMKDYKAMIPQFTEVFPVNLRGLFQKLALEQVKTACSEMLGMRFFEEIYTQTFSAELAPPLNPEPKAARPPVEPQPPTPVNDDDDDLEILF